MVAHDEAVGMTLKQSKYRHAAGFGKIKNLNKGILA